MAYRVSHWLMAGHAIYCLITLISILLSGCMALDAGTFRPAAFPQGGEAGSEYVSPFVPTPQEVVNRMLELARVGKEDVVYDLGSGDGRIVVTAAEKYGARAVGFEIDPVLASQSRGNIREAGVEHLAEIREQDLMTADLSPATVVTVYLYPAANLQLRPVLRRQLKPGSRVVSHDFAMGAWKPDHVEQMTDASGLLRTIYLWLIP